MFIVLFSCISLNSLIRANDPDSLPDTVLLNVKITFIVDRKKAAEAGMTGTDVSEAFSKTLAGMRKREKFRLSDLQNTEIKNPRGMTTKLKELGDVEVEFASAKEKRPPLGSFLMNIKMSFIVDNKKVAEAGMTVAGVADLLEAITSKSMAGMGEREISKLSDLQNSEIKTAKGKTIKMKELGDEEIEFARPQKAMHPKEKNSSVPNGVLTNIRITFIVDRKKGPYFAVTDRQGSTPSCANALSLPRIGW